MLTWLQKLKESNRETKLFLLTVCIYTAGVILPAIYCYARLDSVRSYHIPQKILESETK